MSPLEYTTFWMTVAAYTLGAGLALWGIVFRKDRPLALATFVCGIGLLTNCVAIGARISFTGHLPVASRYENILLGTAVVMFFSVLSLVKRPSLRPILVFTSPFALLMLGYALLNQPRYTTMSLVLDNLWMFVHIFFAWLGYGAYSLAAAIGVLYLLRARKTFEELPEEELPALFARLPSMPVLEDLIFRYIIFGFVAHVVMIVTGCIWARDLWGTYWSWDPVETWSLLSAILYGLWIHLRVTLHWHGKRMAWLAVVALISVIFAFWGTSLLGNTGHSLDDLKLRTPTEIQ